MNIGVRVSFWIRVLSGYMLRSGIAGSYSNSIFSFKRECISESPTLVVKDLFSLLPPSVEDCISFPWLL